jgi:hypothetical protein
MYQRKHFALLHEVRCNNNPENSRACLNECMHLTHKTAKVYIGIDGYYSQEPIYEDKILFFCKNKNKFLYPPLSGHKGTYFTEFYNEDYTNNPMPIECKNHEKETGVIYLIK